MSQDDDQLVERVARALAANDAQNGRSPHLHYSEYADIMWIPMARAALSALPERELLAEALEALDAMTARYVLYAGGDDLPFAGNHDRALIEQSRAAADKIRAALEQQQKETP